MAILGSAVLGAWAQDVPNNAAPPVGGNADPVTQMAEKTASQRYDEAMAAFEAGEYGKADALFTDFVAVYGAEPVLADAVERMKPLRALAKLRLKQFDAALPMVDAALAGKAIKPNLRDELLFWRGLCLMQVKGPVGAIDYRAAQRAFGEFYRDHKNQAQHRARCHECLLLFGVCNTLQGEHADAVEFFQWQMPRLRRESKEAAARATILLLYGLLKAGDGDAALRFVIEQYADIASVTQLISFQTLTLELGSRFLDAGEYHKAIACLQRVWPRGRLIDHQAARIADLDGKLEILRARGLDDFIFRYDGMRRRVVTELENFKTIPNFDAALRLRLATAFQGLGRYREAALVMEDMLERLEPDELVAGATVTLMQCWMEVGRERKAIDAADTFVVRFAEGEASEKGRATLPVVLFLKGRALHDDGQHQAALELFREVYRRFPDSSVAGNALFMQGIVLLAMDETADGIALFEDMRRELPDHPLTDDAHYWQGMGYSFAAANVECREHLADYLQRFANGRYVPDANFRRAFALFGLADYAAAAGELRSYLAEFPGDGYNDEGRLLLGDALLALGEIDAGIESYRSISPSSTRFFEDGWFKIGKALKLQKKYPEMREHYREFVATQPASRRMAEAVYWIGWTHTAEGAPTKAREIYWESIRQHGNRPELFGIADLCDGLRKLYPKGERNELALSFGRLASEARLAKRATLELHAQWALSRNANPSSASYEVAVGRALELLDRERHNPRILADCADYLRERGDIEEADALYADLRKWHPRAAERDRAFLARAEIALEEGRADDALRLIARIEEETAYSPRVTDARLLKARLLAANGDPNEGLAVLETLLEDNALPSGAKAAALFRSGEILAGSGDALKATAYFERVYVAYGKYRDLVAQAYLRRGELLEELDKRDEAVEVYRELARRPDLKDRGEPGEARVRLKRMGADA